MCVIFFVAGSYIARCRPALFSGYSFADGCVEPALQYSGFADGRIADVIQTRPFSSSIGLWTLFRLVQITSLPQYVDGCGMLAEVGGVFGSRTVSGTWLAEFVFGSRTGRKSALSSSDPYSGP